MNGPLQQYKPKHKQIDASEPWVKASWLVLLPLGITSQNMDLD